MLDCYPNIFLLLFCEDLKVSILEFFRLEMEPAKDDKKEKEGGTKQIDVGKEAAIEAEVQAARQRAIVPLEIRMKQFRDMLAEKEVFFGEGGKRYFIVLRNRYLARMNLLPCNLAVLNILN